MESKSFKLEQLYGGGGQRSNSEGVGVDSVHPKSLMWEGLPLWAARLLQSRKIKEPSGWKSRSFYEVLLYDFH